MQGLANRRTRKQSTMAGLNPERPGDLKEAYNVTPLCAEVWPEEEAGVAGFKGEFLGFYSQCVSLAQRVLYSMALGLGLPDPHSFVHCHNLTTGSNSSTLRYLHYPPLTTNAVKAGQIRCGEHSDYGSITLLFQDHIGGLQVQHKEAGYVDATPIPGTVVVNISDLMQRWTSDTLLSTKHRVVIPESEIDRKQGRRSVAFFVEPDEDYVVQCLDGSNKYDPITTRDYLDSRFAATY